MKNSQPDRRRSDPAARLAHFLCGYQAPEGLTKEQRRTALKAAISKRFPDITDDELIRGYQIATELKRADTVELNAETAKLQAELRRRKEQSGGS